MPFIKFFIFWLNSSIVYTYVSFLSLWNIMKSWLKRTLIWTWSVIVLGWAWAGATKLGYIPNWLGLEILCPWEKCVDCSDIVFSDYKVSEVLPESCCPWTYHRTMPTQKIPDDDLKDWKPIIYFYPEETSEVSVKLWKSENLLHTYPKYVDWWKVIASPDWTLIDTTNNRSLYALYWEWINEEPSEINEWFVVKWEDTISFLEEKLATLWLNEREAEEFIVYWLPVLENNKWNLIRFRTLEEINKIMPLDITPTPDTVIRVLMQYKPLDEYQEVSEQELTTPERNWFTVVEWWGEANNIVK